MNLETLQSRRAWLASGAALAVLIVAVSYFLVILPKLGAASDTRTQANDTDVANTAVLARQSVLARQQRGIAAMRADLAAALTALPATSALPEFTNEVTQAAATTGVTLQNISVGTPAAVVSAAAAPASPAATDSATTSSTTSTASAAGPTPSSPAQYQLNITLATSGSTENQLAFVKKIQNGPRRALLTSSSFTSTGSKVVMTSQLTIFTSPMSEQQVAQLRKLLAAD
ncbi:hypothetical protein [uncultured Jatrophihabitans sp.]|uniref:hypothetical protein n=1 Tax=uncultured Jatrophihabitans sp. TaxID=1610747 RepID=UPI0035CB3547